MFTQAVQAFHAKHGFTIGEDLQAHGSLGSTASDIASSQLEAAALVLKALSTQWERGTLAPASGAYDDRLMRAHLILEEVAETLLGLARRDPVLLLDGLADTLYVIAGTAVAYGMPLEYAFQEVHASNMTKSSRPNDVRLRTKGDEYQPPDIAAVLALQLTDLQSNHPDLAIFPLFEFSRIDDEYCCTISHPPIDGVGEVSIRGDLALMEELKHLARVTNSGTNGS